MACPVCSHDNRHTIDQRLAQGAPLAELASFWGVSAHALQKHQAEHLRNVAVRMRTDPTSPLVDLDRLQTKLWGYIEMAEGIKDGSGEYVVKPNPLAAVAAVAEMRKVTMAQITAAKELRMFKDDVISRDQLHSVVEKITRALADYPEALDAVKAALEDLD